MVGRRPRAQSLYARDAASLAGAIRAAREANGLTQEQLAQASELSLSTVRKIERSAIVEPGFFPVMAILAVLRVDTGALKLPTVQRLRGAKRRGQRRASN
jgi:transcriptional regulator with XRE-family HTH domain